MAKANIEDECFACSVRCSSVKEDLSVGQLYRGDLESFRQRCLGNGCTAGWNSLFDRLRLNCLGRAVHLIDNRNQDGHKSHEHDGCRNDLQPDHLAAHAFEYWVEWLFALVVLFDVTHAGFSLFREIDMVASFKQDETNRKVLNADESASGRLDAWLAEALGGEFSRNRIKALIEDGMVLMNGKSVTEPKKKVKPGDEIDIHFPDPEDPTPQGEDIALEVLFEDDDLIVISKPAGLVVHPGAGNWTGTLVNALIHHCGESLSGIGGVKRPGIVHRLDKETSGVMVVAKNDIAHRHLAAQFADHGRTGPLERAYLALVWDRPRQLKGTIDAPLGRSGDRVRRAVKREESADAREAITHYEVVERFLEQSDATALASLVECRLETGRTHQIRVHMAHIGHPLIGDPEYGGAFRTKANRLPEETRAVVNGLHRQALHAFLLQFEHPVTGEVMRFEAPVPADMQAVIDALRDTR
jgi:23S rRNA pseudouridine1911/1915/1917 synthase